MEFLFKPVDIARLAVFRVLFGLIMFFETVGAVLIGWVDEVYVSPQFTFSFIGFEWLQPLPGNWMYLVFSVLGLLSLGVSVGYRYRLSAVLLWIGWSYVYIIHKTSYNNHHYLMWLLIGIMAVLPANRHYSLDVRQGRVDKRNWCRQWHVAIFIGLYGIVYTYAAIAKLYPDWYEGIPMDIWFEPKSQRALIGSIYSWPPLPGIFAWGGIIFDFLIIPALVWKRTRKAAFALSILFHLGNSVTFQIGTFPYLMIASSVLFFPDSVIRRIFLRKQPEETVPNSVSLPPHPKITGYLLGGFFLVQVLLPLRHHTYPGNVFWTEEGHRLSWRMMLKSKSGNCTFDIRKEDGSIIEHNPMDFLTREQYFTMASRPDMIWQYCQRLKKMYGESIRIYVMAHARVNRGTTALLINPEVDMAGAEWHRFRHDTWIEPFPGWTKN